MARPRQYLTILDAAILVAERDGLMAMRREAIAAEVDVAVSLVSYYLGTMLKARRTVMRHAVKRHRYKIIAEGLVHKDPHAMKAPDDVKKAALEAVL